jgi:hypothetical protein
MPKHAKTDELTRLEPPDRIESTQAAEGGLRLLIACVIAVVASAALLLDRSVTIAASDSDIAFSKSASTAGFAGQAWAR